MSTIYTRSPEQAAVEATKLCRPKLSEKEYKELNSDVVDEIVYAYYKGRRDTKEEQHLLDGEILQLKRAETAHEILAVLFFAIAVISLMRVVK